MNNNSLSQTEWEAIKLGDSNETTKIEDVGPTMVVETPTPKRYCCVPASLFYFDAGHSLCLKCYKFNVYK